MSVTYRFSSAAVRLVSYATIEQVESLTSAITGLARTIGEKVIRLEYLHPIQLQTYEKRDNDPFVFGILEADGLVQSSAPCCELMCFTVNEAAEL